MIKILFVVVFIAIAIVLFFNNNPVESPKTMPIEPPVAQEPVSTGSTYYLTADTISELTTKADAGDGDAATKLYKYYRFTKGDKLKSMHWLEVAANAGNYVAQHNFAYELLENKNFAEARKWALAAQKNGDESAKSLLAEIEKRQLKAN